MKDKSQGIQWRKTKAYRKLERDLLDNLEGRGLVDGVYRDKVAEYMDLWIQRQMLMADVAERGVKINSEKYGETENRSLTLGVQVSRQMLAIYTALGFKEPQGTGSSKDADDEL